MFAFCPLFVLVVVWNPSFFCCAFYDFWDEKLPSLSFMRKFSSFLHILAHLRYTKPRSLLLCLLHTPRMTSFEFEIHTNQIFFLYAFTSLWTVSRDSKWSHAHLNFLDLFPYQHPTSISWDPRLHGRMQTAAPPHQLWFASPATSTYYVTIYVFDFVTATTTSTYYVTILVFDFVSATTTST